MIRDEERQVHNLPAEPGTMSAREALAHSIFEAGLGNWATFAVELAEWKPYNELAGLVMSHLASLGFAVLPAIPSPR